MNLLKKRRRKNLTIFKKEKNRMSDLPIRIRQFYPEDILPICSWVKNSRELADISSDNSDYLTEEILNQWRIDSIAAVVLEQSNEPTAFCTLSTKEYDLPSDWVEVCHLVINPSHRRKYYATTLLNYLRLIAAQLDYQQLVGRIVRDNIPALKLADYVRWNEIECQSNFDPAFRWYSYELRK